MDRQQALNSIRALESWAKKVTNGYQDVNVRDMTSSFRDGLAFCAIIHHFRPDLLSFESLSKENILQNNSLAFSVAEKQLGVPALLDAEDMVKYSRPDRLSIITYLSQLHNCFENQNKVNTMKAAVKRIPSNNTEGPPAKVSIIKPVSLTPVRHEVCTACSHRVFILERLIVDGKLYHRTCFRCSKCKCLLNPGTYIEGDSPGTYECSVCPLDDSSDSSEVEDSRSIDSLEDKLPDPTPSPKPVLRTVHSPSPSAVRVASARNSFLKQNLSPSENNRKTFFKLNDTSPNDSTNEHKSREKVATVRDKISAFETNKEPYSVSKQDVILKNDSKLSPTTCSEGSSPKPNARQSLFLLKGVEEKTNTQNTFEESSSDFKTADVQHIPSSLSLPTIKKVSENDKNSNYNSTSENKISSSSTTLNSQPEQRKYTSVFDPHKYQLGEYKSPLRASRDIFKTNFQPLKLSASGGNQKDSDPSVLCNYSKVGEVSTGYTQSSYIKNLQRPMSVDSLSTKAEPCKNMSAEANLSDNIDLKLHKTKPRRLSLDSSSKSDNNKLDSDENRCLSEDRVLLEAENKSEDHLDSKMKTTLSTTQLPIPTIRKSLLLNKTIDSSEKLSAELTIMPQEPAITEKKTSTTAISTEVHKMPKSTISASIASEIPKTTLTKPDAAYPGDLNPFGEEEVEYPDDLNPFGDEDETSRNEESDKASIPSSINKSGDEYDESMNPFASDEDDDNDHESVQPFVKSQVSPKTVLPTSSTPTRMSPTGSLRGTLKKRLAPKPPRISDIFPNDSQESDVSLSSLKSSPSVSRRSFRTTSPKLRKSKPAPPPPPVTTPIKQNDEDESKSNSSTVNHKIEASMQAKKKKRPAPPVPIPKRLENKKIPLKDILREMKEIEVKQRECEQHGRDIELLIRDKDKEEEASVEEEEYIMQLFELVNQKNALFRRQAELMYIKRSQRLEEQQAELENQIRELFGKPESEKTDNDRIKEEELIMELKDVVDQRSSIIDSIEMDRRREMEEDVSIQEQTEIKNGELPIAAEMKSKIEKKKNDKKEKKDKKKKKKDKDDANSKKEKKDKKKKWFPKTKAAE